MKVPMESNSRFLKASYRQLQHNLILLTLYLISYEALTSISSSALNHISSNVSGTLGSLGGGGGGASSAFSTQEYMIIISVTEMLLRSQ